MMTLVRTIGRELLGLFVDDSLLAVAIVVWLGLVALLVAVAGAAHPALIGPLLFVGLAAVLLASVWRRARR